MRKITDKRSYFGKGPKPKWFRWIALIIIILIISLAIYLGVKYG